ncbi:5396_t:CDS:2 [Entrophospora sp. SA101]|nr:5396_t:CDS:2 [Entrophospora sp. SA101]
MGNVYPLRPLCSDFPISNAYRLDNVFEQELEKKLYDTLKAAPELNNGNKNLCRIYVHQKRTLAYLGSGYRFKKGNYIDI